VHGDLHVRHVLLDDGGGAVGVVDWGDVCLADPAVDLALAYTAFSGPARAAFLAAYEEVDAERELRARALGVRLSAFLTAYAADVDRPALLAEALARLRRVVG
jgi:aminoglycoside phosphotransferase (APT) family kinase protein